MFVSRASVSLGLLYLVLRGIDFAAIQSRLSRINLVWITTAVTVAIIQIVLGTFRWREVSNICRARLSHLKALRYNMVGSFFNQILPSSIGGDAVRLWLVHCGGAGWRAATYSIVTDRAVGLIALVLIIAATLPWSYGTIGDAKGRLALVSIDFVALSGALGFLLFGRLRLAWLKSWWPNRHVHACSVIANQVIFSKRSGPMVTMLSFTIHILAVVIAWCCVRAVDASLDLKHVFILIPPIMLITVMPISIAGWGAREAMMMVAFHDAGLAQTDGAVVSILFGAVYLIVGALGGLVWIFSAEKQVRYIEVARTARD